MGLLRGRPPFRPPLPPGHPYHVKRVAETRRCAARQSSGEEDGPARCRRILRHAGDLWGQAKCTYVSARTARQAWYACCRVQPCTWAPGPRPRAPERAAQGLRYTRYVRGWYTAPCVRHGCGMVHVSTEPGTVVITRLYRAKVGMVMPTCSRGETWSCSAPRVRVMHHAMLHHYHAMSCTLTRRRQ